MSTAETIAALAAAPAPINVLERLNGSQLWRDLTDLQRALIGAAAIELVGAWNGVDVAEQESPIYATPLARACRTAEQIAIGQLMKAFVEAVPRGKAFCADGQPRIPGLLGQVCETCGCSQDDACPDGCGWADFDRCTACGARPGGATP